MLIIEGIWQDNNKLTHLPISNIRSHLPLILQHLIPPGFACLLQTPLSTTNRHNKNYSHVIGRQLLERRLMGQSPPQLCCLWGDPVDKSPRDEPAQSPITVAFSCFLLFFWAKRGGMGPSGLAATTIRLVALDVWIWYCRSRRRLCLCRCVWCWCVLLLLCCWPCTHVLLSSRSI